MALPRDYRNRAILYTFPFPPIPSPVHTHPHTHTHAHTHAWYTRVRECVGSACVMWVCMGVYVCMGVEGSWYLISYNQDPTTPTIPSAAKYLMRRGWVHTRPKYFMRVEPCVRYPPRHAKRDGERRNEVGPLTGGA